MGAGRPEAPGAGEEPAAAVLEHVDPQAAQDTGGAGAPTTTGQLRDSLNGGG